MIQQPKDKLAAARDKREWNEIRKDEGYWQDFWLRVTEYKIKDFEGAQQQ